MVRSIEYLIKKQAESFRFKNEKMLQEIYWNELLGPLNAVASQARLLIDNKKMIQSDVTKAITKSLYSIWS